MNYDWPKVPLNELFHINGQQILPNCFPNEEFWHHSIPALDELGGPILEPGIEIESNKTFIDKPSVLVSKLNPRKPRVSVVSEQDNRQCCSTEFICYQPKLASEPLVLRLLPPDGFSSDLF